MAQIIVDGKTFKADLIELVKGKLLLIQGEKGMLGCGYFNVETADKLATPLAVVTGVSTFDDMLNAKVVKVSRAAADAGVTIGISGKEALLIMK